MEMAMIETAGSVRVQIVRSTRSCVMSALVMLTTMTDFTMPQIPALEGISISISIVKETALLHGTQTHRNGHTKLLTTHHRQVYQDWPGQEGQDEVQDCGIV